MTSKPYYQMDPVNVFRSLDSSSTGLTGLEAQRRLAEYGDNRLESSTEINKLTLLFSQFNSFVIYILLAAVLLSFLLGEFIDATVIILILLFTGLIGYFQELSAYNSLAALRKLSTLSARVYRDEHLIEVDASTLVPGDVIAIQAGDKVPAKARILRAVKLRLDESLITGESLSVAKQEQKLSNEAQLGDQNNMLFATTTVVAGSGLAIVTATGMHTEIGKIASLLTEIETQRTPLQMDLDRFGKRLGYGVIFVCSILLATQIIQSYSNTGLTVQAVFEMLMLAAALAVAAVPEGLAAVVTIGQSIGVKRMLKRNALIKHLASVETLGRCDVICTDKTGTLTENKMTVRSVWTQSGAATLTGVGYTPVGEASFPVNPLLYRIGMACNNASLYLDSQSSNWCITGDPTEAALLVSAKKAGIEQTWTRLSENPFDSDRKLMSVHVKDDDGAYTYLKGAPDSVLDVCTRIIDADRTIDLTPKLRQQITEKIDAYSNNAMRVLAFAFKPMTKDSKFSEDDLIFVGLQCMVDPPRSEVSQAITTAQLAGIRIIMITGDYKGTGKAIGAEIGINGRAVSGQELSEMSDDELKHSLNTNTNIFARVMPEHKQRIIKALQQQNHIVAMTGDGVNDAPALRRADIGIAIGSGTDVAKENSDLVLLDDSFANIIAAVEEGRGIYENIQKSILLLLSGNLTEVLIIAIAVIVGWNLPLTAILLLWINLVTDGAPAVAFSVDPFRKDIMSLKPRPANQFIIPREKQIALGLLSLLGAMLALVLFVYYGGANGDKNLDYARTLVFSFVVLFEMCLVVLIRQGYSVALWSNAWLWIAIVTTFMLHGVLMYTPLSEFFGLVSLSLTELLPVFIAGGVFFPLGYLIIILTQAQKSRQETPKC
ncbi:cation-translocating P-type ATPase [Pseudomonadota bacterium]